MAMEESASVAISWFTMIINYSFGILYTSDLRSVRLDNLEKAIFPPQSELPLV